MNLELLINQRRASHGNRKILTCTPRRACPQSADQPYWLANIYIFFYGRRENLSILGKNLYRITPLGEIIGSFNKIHLYKLQKIWNFYTTYLRVVPTTLQNIQPKIPSTDREIKMINSTANSASFRWTGFLTIHT
jgi:hypothetical protein